MHWNKYIFEMFWASTMGKIRGKYQQSSSLSGSVGHQAYAMLYGTLTTNDSVRRSISMIQ